MLRLFLVVLSCYLICADMMAQARQPAETPDATSGNYHGAGNAGYVSVVVDGARINMKSAIYNLVSGFQRHLDIAGIGIDGKRLALRQHG